MTNPNNPGECCWFCQHQRGGGCLRPTCTCHNPTIPDVIDHLKKKIAKKNAAAPKECNCASFFTVRGVHKKDCPAFAAPKDTQSNEGTKCPLVDDCYCHLFTEPHYHARDNPVKVSYDWLCPVHGQQHREWDIKEYETTWPDHFRQAAEKVAPPPTGAQEGWVEQLREGLLNGTLSKKTGVQFYPLVDFIRTQITTAEEVGWVKRGGFESEQKQRMYEAGITVGAVEHHKRVVERIGAQIAFYSECEVNNSFADLQREKAVIEAVLTDLTTIDPEKKDV